MQFHPIEVMRKDLISSFLSLFFFLLFFFFFPLPLLLEGTVSLTLSGSPPKGRVLESSTGIDGEGFEGNDADAVARIFPIIKLKSCLKKLKRQCHYRWLYLLLIATSSMGVINFYSIRRRVILFVNSFIKIYLCLELGLVHRF